MKWHTLATPVGLGLDLLGVVILGWLAESGHTVYADGKIRLDQSRRWISRGGWGLIIAGFALQLVAQLR
jgi:hypothetical protein